MWKSTTAGSGGSGTQGPQGIPGEDGADGGWPLGDLAGLALAAVRAQVGEQRVHVGEGGAVDQAAAVAGRDGPCNTGGGVWEG